MEYRKIYIHGVKRAAFMHVSLDLGDMLMRCMCFWTSDFKIFVVLFVKMNKREVVYWGKGVNKIVFFCKIHLLRIENFISLLQ